MTDQLPAIASPTKITARLRAAHPVAAANCCHRMTGDTADDRGQVRVRPRADQVADDNALQAADPGSHRPEQACTEPQENQIKLVPIMESMYSIASLRSQ